MTDESSKKGEEKRALKYLIKSIIATRKRKSTGHVSEERECNAASHLCLTRSKYTK